MFREKLMQENGMTLVEVLAGFVLVSIIGVLITAMLVQTFKNEEKVSENQSLKQKTNLQLSTMRKQFYHEKDRDRVCYENNDVSIHLDKISNGDNHDNLAIKDNCIYGIDKDQPLDFVLTAKKGEDTFKIKTTFPSTGKIVVESETPIDDTDPCTMNYQTPSIPSKGKELPCTAFGNFYWDGKSLEKGCPANAYKIGGNLFITDEVATSDIKGIIIQVGGNLFGRDDAQTHLNNITLQVGGNAIFPDQAHFNSVSLQVGGNALFKKQPYFEEQNNIRVTGNACFKDQFKLKKSKMTIGKSASFMDQSGFDQSTAIINGSSFFKDQFDLEHGSLLKIYGNAHFDRDTDVEIDTNSDFCVKGQITGKRLKSTSSCSFTD